jgi:glycosyltransferase involved in cell wall biosynthesis
MKIGLEVSYAFMGRGGVDRFAYGLAEALLARDDNDYVLVTMFAPFRQERLDGAPIRSTLRRKVAMAQVELLRRLWSRLEHPRVELLAGRLDVLHTTHHFTVPARGARLVAAVHDLSFEYPELAIHGAETFSRDMRRAVERADVVIADSEFTKRELEERYRVGADRIRVVYPGVSPGRWTDGPARDASPYFLVAGQIERRKNVLELAHGFALARERAGLPHRLVVAGRPAYGASPIVDELRRTPAVDYLGFVPDSELGALYRGATAFVYPSRYEGFGMSLLEAMAAGTPAIASSAASLPEVVGDAGLLVDPGEPEAWAEALERISGDADLRDSLVERGRARAAEFTWERTAAETAAVYRELGP